VARKQKEVDRLDHHLWAEQQWVCTCLLRGKGEQERTGYFSPVSSPNILPTQLSQTRVKNKEAKYFCALQKGREQQSLILQRTVSSQTSTWP